MLILISFVELFGVAIWEGWWELKSSYVIEADTAMLYRVINTVLGKFSWYQEASPCY